MDDTDKNIHENMHEEHDFTADMTEADSEYQYAEEENQSYSNLYGSEGDKNSKSVRGWLNKRRIFVIIIAIIIIFIIYKLATLFMVSSQKTTTPKPTTSIATKQVETTQPKTVSTFATQPTTQQSTTQPASQLAQIQTSTAPTTTMSNLEQQVKANNSQLTQINTAMTNLSNTMANISATLTSINNQLQGLADKVAKQVRPVVQHSERKPRERRRRRAQAVVSSRYYVQALIPGRAWVKGPKGTITVGQGDTIPGLGRVTEIDVQRGVVVTSSGAEIHYGIREG